MARKKLCRNCFNDFCKGGPPCIARANKRLRRIKEDFIKNWQNYLPFQQDRIASLLGLVRAGSKELSR